MDKHRRCWQRGASTCCHRVPWLSPVHPQAQAALPVGLLPACCRCRDGSPAPLRVTTGSTHAAGVLRTH